MSAIDSILPQGSPANAPNKFSELTSEEFIKIMFTELSNQDPLKPNDSAALLEQMSSIRSIQSDLELTQRLDSLVTQNQLASAGNLIGEFVSGLAFGNQRVAGFVVSISRTQDGPVLNLDNGYRVPFKHVDEIIDGSLLEEIDDPTGPNPPPGNSNNTGGNSTPTPPVNGAPVATDDA